MIALSWSGVAALSRRIVSKRLQQPSPVDDFRKPPLCLLLRSFELGLTEVECGVHLKGLVCVYLCQCIASPTFRFIFLTKLSVTGRCHLQPAGFSFNRHFLHVVNTDYRVAMNCLDIFFFPFQKQQFQEQKKKTSINKMVKVRIAFRRDKPLQHQNRQHPVLLFKKQNKTCQSQQVAKYI